MTWSFIQHVSNYLSKPRFGEQKAPTVWPSSATAIVEDQIVGKCRRQAYFRFANDQYEFDPEYDYLKPLHKEIKKHKLPPSNYLRWIWIQGELYETYCINMAKEAGVYIADQVSIYVPGYNISGKIDLIVINPEESTMHIVEVKSVYGFNANSVLGTEAQNRKGKIGTPRDSHLMQLGIYQWWYGNCNDGFGAALLTYGARDTGRFAEYLITVEKGEDGLDYIFYQGHVPITTTKVNSGITIQSILENYKLVQDSLQKDQKKIVIPPADYTLRYSEETIQDMYEKGLLGKTDSTQHEKRKKQIEEGKARPVKAVEKGDWQCKFCDYKNLCYDENYSLIELNL
tara:strand:- start:3468 stop:4493 length:1026 start_codon:yes stop_codon:yes gene_type:complete